jgi:hypothetical protein
LGVFANALNLANERDAASGVAPRIWPSLAARLVARLRQRAIKEARLMVVERISLAPRQIVALIEADGQRLLVATSPDGAPVFFPLKPAAARSTTKRAALPEVEGNGL